MNKIYDNDFFNGEQKKRFLKDMTENTYMVHSRVLKRASRLEKNLNKDLYDFNLDEIEELLNYLSPKTVQASLTNGSVINAYIGWAIQQDLRTINLNPLDIVGETDFYKSFVDKTNKLIFSEEEVKKIVFSLESRQDAVIIQALFEGIMGRNNSELLNLKLVDIDADSHKVLLRNIDKDNTEQTRFLKISDPLLRLMQEASQETEYKSIMGTGGRVKKLVPSPYVIKGAGKASADDGKTGTFAIRQRIKNIGIMEGYDYLSAINIRNSGMLKMARDLYEETNKLKREEIEAICRHFNVGIAKDGHIASTPYTREFLNLETLFDVYPEIE
ncbi:phage lytic cycle repressor MrpR family protein [Paenibacillus sp. T2-29]|uniref:phage lytic cycle repressor MrpR family protein n=1 Tax=Paenibacillus TaxID=44249 RepID=UPI0039BCEF55